MEFKEKYLIIIGLVVLISTIAIAGVSVNKSGKLSSQDIASLKDYTNQTEINPQISPCMKINEFECRARIYQESLINKEVIITTNSCSEWDLTDNSVCRTWDNLTKAQIENKVSNKTMKILKDMAKVKQKRDSSPLDFLTDEINLSVEEEQ